MISKWINMWISRWISTPSENKNTEVSKTCSLYNEITSHSAPWNWMICPEVLWASACSPLAQNSLQRSENQWLFTGCSAAVLPTRIHLNMSQYRINTAPCQRETRFLELFAAKTHSVFLNLCLQWRAWSYSYETRDSWPVPSVQREKRS